MPVTLGFMGFDRHKFPEMWEKMCAGSGIELGEHVWLNDALLFYPDAVVDRQPLPLLFDLDSIIDRFELPCGRIDLTTEGACLWMLTSRISTQAEMFRADPETRLFAFIDEVPWGVNIATPTRR